MTDRPTNQPNNRLSDGETGSLGMCVYNWLVYACWTTQFEQSYYIRGRLLSTFSHDILPTSPLIRLSGWREKCWSSCSNKLLDSKMNGNKSEVIWGRVPAVSSFCWCIDKCRFMHFLARSALCRLLSVCPSVRMYICIMYIRYYSSSLSMPFAPWSTCF